MIGQFLPLFHRARSLADQLETEAERAALLPQLVERVDLSRTGFTLVLNLSLMAPTAEPMTQFIPLRLKRRGVETRLILGGLEQVTPKADPALFKAVVRARAWGLELTQGHAASAAQIAAREGITNRYVHKVVKLAFLAPEIVEAIIEGRQPAGLTADVLIRDLELPIDWQAQKALLGFI